MPGWGPAGRYRLPGLLLLLLLGCGADHPRLPPLAPDALVLAFGDSLTQGTGAPPEQNYPAWLERLTGRPVLNAGVPGELSSQGLARLPGLLDEHRPRLLLLCHGGNDLLRRQDPAALEANLRAMVQAARSRGIPLVLIAVPQPSLLAGVAGGAPVYERLAAEFHIPLERDAVAKILTDRGLKSDQVHPNGPGYRALAERLRDLLAAAGALPQG